MSVLTRSRRGLPTWTSEADSRRRGRRVLVVTVLSAVLGATVGWWASTTLSPGFVSTASIVVRPLPGNAFSDGEDATLVTLQTEAQLARSDDVLIGVSTFGSGPDTLEALRSRLSVSVVEGAEVIRISYRAPTSDQSVQVAEQVASSTLYQRGQRGATARTVQVSELAGLINDTLADLAVAEPGPRTRLLSQRLVVLRDQLRTVKAQRLDPGSVIGVFTVSDSRRTLKLGLVGAGALTGAVSGWWLASRIGRKRISDPVFW